MASFKLSCPIFKYSHNEWGQAFRMRILGSLKIQSITLREAVFKLAHLWVSLSRLQISCFQLSL